MGCFRHFPWRHDEDEDEDEDDQHPLETMMTMDRMAGRKLLVAVDVVEECGKMMRVLTMLEMMKMIAVVACDD